MKPRKLIIYGDSISGITHGNGGYQRILESESVFSSISNYAIGASGLSPETPNNLHKLIFRYNRYDRDATAILIWHGTNDWFYGVSVDEFKRNFQDIYSRLKQECPIANFLFLTPIFRFETARGNHEPGDGFETQNLSGNTLLDFENAVIDLAETYKVDFVNMRLETKFTIANVNDFYEDKVHPNERGYEVISKIIIEKLRKI